MQLQRMEVRREPLATEVAKTILDYLLAGHIEPGDRIASERRLAEELGVGRSVVREALKSLTLLGLIEVRPGDGTYLRRAESAILPQALEWGLLLGEKRVSDLIEARHHLEVLITKLAATRRTEADLSALHEYLDQMRNAQDTDDFVAGDIAFHVRVAQAAGNETFVQIMTSISTLLHVWIKRVRSAEADNTRSYLEHEAVMTALEKGDPTLAQAAMEAHMSSATRRLNETIQSHMAASATPSA